MQSTYKQIYKELTSAQNIFIVGHPRCGDALGSTLAMAWWLKSMGKEYLAFSRETVPDNLTHLPGYNEIVTKLDNINNLEIFDVVLIVDTDYPHSGISEKLEQEIDKDNTCVINIDHHITNDGQGDINLIDKSSDSTTRMLYDFFKFNNIKISKPMAECLLTGIISDTGIFSNAATDRSSLSTAADLLQQGVSLNTIINEMVNNKSIKLLRLWGRVLEKLRHHKLYDIVFTTMTGHDFSDELDTAKAGELANFLNNLTDGKFVMIVKDVDENLVKFSLRTTHDNVDVAKFAEYFGGGGHRKAAGFAIPGSLVYNEHEDTVKII